MSTAFIPVDLFNPGQVFAALGLMELGETLLGEVQAGFDWSDPASVRFVLRAKGEADPIAAGLRFLTEAEVHALAPPVADLDCGKWNVPTRRLDAGGPFPNPMPSSPAPLPAVLVSGGHSVVVESWGDVGAPNTLTTGRDNLKFWGGSGGYPGVAILRDALDAVRPRVVESRDDPFNLSAAQSSSFRFDWRRDYVPIDAGFSLNNEHPCRIVPRGFPLVEVLAAIGLTHARPRRIHKLQYRYAVAGRADRREPEPSALLPPPFLRAALGTAQLPFAMRTFTMQLDWPGQENQARCITTVVEESDS